LTGFTLKQLGFEKQLKTVAIKGIANLSKAFSIKAAWRFVGCLVYDARREL
jgi:hypothetical protein